MTSAATHVQTQDTKKVNLDIFGFLQPSDKIDLGVTIPHSLPKARRGLENYATARFLIPRKHLDAFEQDPKGYVILQFEWLSLMLLASTIAKLKAQDEDPNWQLIAEEWPTFLYDEQAGWSEAKVNQGLFRGHVLVRVSRTF